MEFPSKTRPFSGQLYKYTNVVKGWQYRFFLLDANAGQLHYYLCDSDRPEKPESQPKEPRGSVHLSGAVICPSEEDSRTFSVNCANGDILKLRAADARARQEWVNGLRAVAESHTKTVSQLPPREQLAVSDALGCVRAQLQITEQSDATLCRTIESSGPSYFTDHNLLLLKATSAAALHCLLQCSNILQRDQQSQIRSGLITEDD